jgi:hypothetical protein
MSCKHSQAIEDKRLFLASGGHFGGYMASNANAELLLIPGQHWLKHYHASYCKNTAHKFAAYGFLQQGFCASEGELPGTRAILCNLDCDNIMFPAFAQASLEAMAAKAQTWEQKCGSFAMVPPSSCGQSGGCTGRRLYFLEDFVTSGGYDQETGILGSGHPAAESVYQTGEAGHGRHTIHGSCRSMMPDISWWI